MTANASSALLGTDIEDDEGLTPREVATALSRRWRLLLLTPLAAGAAAFGIATLIPPTFTASTTFMPPQQQQSATSVALNSLGPLAGLAGATGLTSSTDRYIALMQSATVADRLIDEFKLMAVYGTKLRVEARAELASNVRISAGKKDGLITVAVDDHNPQRAADLANHYVEELRRLTGTLAVTEAQQRRMFFERQLQQSRDRLTRAQQALQTSGFNLNALKAEPKAAAEAVAALKAQTTAAEVRLQTLRSALADDAPEVRQQQTALSALRAQMARTEQAGDSPSSGADYIGKYREFKYQETLFDLYARQFELAKADESREGALIQVVDPASAPEKRSEPRRSRIATAASALTFIALAIGIFIRQTLLPQVSRRQ